MTDCRKDIFFSWKEENFLKYNNIFICFVIGFFFQITPVTPTGQSESPQKSPYLTFQRSASIDYTFTRCIMGLGEGQGRGSGGRAPGICWSLLWFIVMIVAWWISFLLVGIYVLLLPFSACIAPVRGLSDSLLHCLTYPGRCAENMINMTPMC